MENPVLHPPLGELYREPAKYGEQSSWRPLQAAATGWEPRVTVTGMAPTGWDRKAVRAAAAVVVTVTPVPSTLPLAVATPGRSAAALGLRRDHQPDRATGC